jgi:hypothetical protein
MDHLLSIAALITASAGFIGMILLHLRSSRVNRADIAGQYQIIANRATERSQLLEGKLEEVKSKIPELELEIKQLKAQISALLIWAERLEYQIRSLGQVPIKRYIDSEEEQADVEQQKI